MLVLINILLAFINARSPYFPQTLFRLSLTDCSFPALPKCSPLAFWLKIDFPTYCCLPDYPYWLCICLSQWTMNSDGQRSHSIHLCLFCSILHNSFREQVPVKVFWNGIKFTNCVKSLCYMVFSWIAEPHQHSGKPLHCSFLRGYVLLLGSYGITPGCFLKRFWFRGSVYVTMWAKLLTGATQLRITKESWGCFLCQSYKLVFIVANERHLCWLSNRKYLNPFSLDF